VTQFDHRYELEGLVATYENMPTQKRDEMTADHQPQSKALKNVAKLSAFDNLFVQIVALPAEREQAPGGYCINVHQRRHEAGRTFGNKSKGDDGTLSLFNANLAAKGASKDKRPNSSPNPHLKRAGN